MPLRREAYAKVKPNGPYPGLEPMKNFDGHEAWCPLGRGLVYRSDVKQRSKQRSKQSSRYLMIFEYL